jgi:hypothetical protein
MIRPEPPLMVRREWSDQRWALDQFIRFLESQDQQVLDRREFPEFPGTPEEQEAVSRGGTGALLALLDTEEGVSRVWGWASRVGTIWSREGTWPGGEEGLLRFAEERERRERETELRDRDRGQEHEQEQRAGTGAGTGSRNRSRSREGQREQQQLVERRLWIWRDRQEQVTDSTGAGASGAGSGARSTDSTGA